MQLKTKSTFNLEQPTLIPVTEKVPNRPDPEVLEKSNRSVRPGKVAYFSGCESRLGWASHPLSSEFLDLWGGIITRFSGLKPLLIPKSLPGSVVGLPTGSSSG